MLFVAINKKKLCGPPIDGSHLLITIYVLYFYLIPTMLNITSYILLDIVHYSSPICKENEEGDDLQVF